MSARPIIDVSELPHHGFDAREPVWWGNNSLLAIETTMFAISIATYYYLRQNFQLWPPPLAQMTGPLDPLPDLTIGTINTVLLVFTCIPVIFLDKAARRGDYLTARITLVLVFICGIAATVLRCFEFPAMKFRWDTNAYGSIVWFLLGMHLAHLLTVTLETMLMLLWAFIRGFDKKHRVDITTVTIYWYWVVGIWLLLYGIIYFTPRLG